MILSTPSSRSLGAIPGLDRSKSLRAAASPAYCSTSEGVPSFTKYVVPEEELTRGGLPLNVAEGSMRLRTACRMAGIVMINKR